MQFILRDSAGYPQLETSDAEEFIAAVDDHPDWHWDDQDTLNLDTIRDHADAARETRKWREGAIKEGVLNKDGTPNLDHPQHAALRRDMLGEDAGDSDPDSPGPGAKIER